MRVIAYKRIREAIAHYPDAATLLDDWYKTAERATWKNLIEVRSVYPHADVVGRLTVFNIRGNHYRLIVSINYSRQVIYIKYILTHVEYDQEEWKNDPYY